ncbi:unnamed protein product, partial [Linum tenue]
ASDSVGRCSVAKVLPFGFLGAGRRPAHRDPAAGYLFVSSRRQSAASTSCLFLPFPLPRSRNNLYFYQLHLVQFRLPVIVGSVLAMSEPPRYPPVDPTTFDLIVIGTGLPESVIAAAASTSGKSVLHLDPNPFYGSHFASLSIPELTSFLNSSSAPLDSLSSSHAADGATEDPNFSIINLSCRSLYSDVEISSLSPTLLEECSRKFLLDVSGPRVLFCADKAIDLMMKSEASQYVEFKGIDASFIGDGNGALSAVPDSRAAIFKDKSLNLIQKNQLMRFFKLVQGHLRATAAAASTIDENQNEEGEVQEAASMISEEDLESPFVDFLTKMQLPPKIKSYTLLFLPFSVH